MAVRRLDEVLAQTDPFDLAQAVQRYVSSLDEVTVRTLVANAAQRAGTYYRTELLALQERGDDDALRGSLVRFLQSNLRAIALFGPSFGEHVLEACPAHRVVAIGEERRGTPPRGAVMAAAALGLLIIGAAGEHALNNARSAAQTPQPQITQIPYAALPAATPRHVARVSPQRSRPAVHVAPAPQAAPVAMPPPIAPVQLQRPAPVPRTRPVRSQHVAGVAVTVNATPAPPTPAPTPIDVNDMPNAYTDATALPSPTSVPAAVPRGPITVATPKPTPKPKSWLHKTLMHFDPFQPGGRIR